MVKMMIKRLFNKYKELILYIIFGVLTTLVNFAAFWLLTKILGESLYLINNAVAWIISVVFAYVTNKLFVFESKSLELKVVIREITEFFAARLFSFAVEEGGLVLFVRLLHFGKYSLEILSFEISGQMIAKVILAVIVVILNYFFSKFIIFTQKTEKNN